MSRPFRSRAVFLGICSAMFIFGLILHPQVSHAGEIYGRVARGEKVFPGAIVSIKCPSFPKGKRTKTNMNGKYRLPSGPRGKEKCIISINGAKNFVTIYTSERRTRANLEIVRGRLRKR